MMIFEAIIFDEYFTYKFLDFFERGLPGAGLGNYYGPGDFDNTWPREGQQMDATPAINFSMMMQCAPMPQLLDI